VESSDAVWIAEAQPDFAGGAVRAALLLRRKSAYALADPAGERSAAKGDREFAEWTVSVDNFS